MYAISIRVSGPHHSSTVTFRMDVGSKTLGRKGADLIVEDPYCSRQHAILQASMRGLLLTDLQSTNGTLLNGTRIVSQSLQAGDRIQIGDTVLDILSFSWSEAGVGLGFREVEAA